MLVHVCRFAKSALCAPKIIIYHIYIFYIDFGFFSFLVKLAFTFIILLLICVFLFKVHTYYSQYNF